MIAGDQRIGDGHTAAVGIALENHVAAMQHHQRLAAVGLAVVGGFLQHTPRKRRLRVVSRLSSHRASLSELPLAIATLGSSDR